jgi:hypothetical protein
LTSKEYFALLPNFLLASIGLVIYNVIMAMAESLNGPVRIRISNPPEADCVRYETGAGVSEYMVSYFDKISRIFRIKEFYPVGKFSTPLRPPSADKSSYGG